MASIAVALLILGPALGRGVVVAYDMPWAPDARLTPFALGVGTPAPRAVPSDAMAAVLGMVLGASVTQKLALLAILVLIGTGAAALLRQVLPGSGALAGTASATTAVWSAFVAERLVVGQWTVLLGYAVLPWIVRAVIRLRQGEGALIGVIAWLALAGVGGANTLVVGGLGLAGLLLPPVGWRTLAATTASWIGFAAVWALPAIAAASDTTGGAQEFRPRPDSAWGVLGSLITTGGFWNPASYPAGRDVPVLATAALLLSAAGAAAAIAACCSRRSGPVVISGVTGLLLAVMSVTPGLTDVWAVGVERLPGGGLLRDSQKFVAAWALLLAVGSGVLVAAISNVAAKEIAAVTGAMLALVPVALIPALAWGVGGRLVSTTVPDSYRSAVAELNRMEPGVVGVLPWRQYRRYDWNGSRISLTLLPRLSTQQVLYDDSLPLANGTVPGEDPRAAKVGAAIAAGTDPVSALIMSGVRYVAIERGTGLGEPTIPARAKVLIDNPALAVIDLGGRQGPETAGGAIQVGWVVTLAAWTSAAGLWVATMVGQRRRRPLTSRVSRSTGDLQKE